MKVRKPLVLISMRVCCAELSRGWVMQGRVGYAQEFGFHLKGSRESQEDLKLVSNIRFALWKDHSGYSL